MPAGGKRLKIRAVEHGGRGQEERSLFDFDKSVNPIPTGREDYVYPHN